MGLLNIFKQKSMLDEVKECRSTPGAVLLDVRSPDEYMTGHIPGSVNVPVSRIHEAEKLIRSKDTMVCVYCQSGFRAANAVTALRGKGYTNVKNIGGMKKYHGKIDR